MTMITWVIKDHQSWADLIEECWYRKGFDFCGHISSPRKIEPGDRIVDCSGVHHKVMEIQYHRDPYDMFEAKTAPIEAPE